MTRLRLWLRCMGRHRWIFVERVAVSQVAVTRMRCLRCGMERYER